MANWCDFKITLRTNEKEHIKEFLKHIQKSNNNYDNYKYRVIPRASYYSISEIYEIDNFYYLSLGGSCAWSCDACMLLSSKINYNKLMKSHNNLYGDETCNHAISIEELCAIYNTEAEIVGNECEIGFTEHYYIDNKGKLVVNETRDFDVESLWNEESFEIPDNYDLVIKVDKELKRNAISSKAVAKNNQEHTEFSDFDYEDDLPF